MSSDSPPRVIFLHSPKTGGTTFRGVLQQAYPTFGACTDPGVDAIRRCLETHEAIEILGAESDGGGTMFANQELMQEESWDVLRDAEVFVMFRDPVDFAVSLYHHIVRNRDTRRVRGAYANHPDSMAFTLERFVEDPHHANIQLSFLVGNLPFHTGRLTDASDLEHGFSLLDSLGFHVGLTERYEDFLHEFEATTGKVIPGRVVERRNANPDGEGARVRDPRMRQRIADANALDQALYEHAREIVRRQAEARGPRPRYRFVEPAGPRGAGSDRGQFEGSRED